MMNSPQPRGDAGRMFDNNDGGAVPRYGHGVTSMSMPGGGMLVGASGSASPAPNPHQSSANTSTMTTATTTTIIIDRPLRALTVDEVQTAKRYTPNVYNAVIQYDALYLNALSKIEGKENELKRCIEVGQEVLTQLQTLRKRCQSLEAENGELVSEIERLRLSKNDHHPTTTNNSPSSSDAAAAANALRAELQGAVRQNNNLRADVQRLEAELAASNAAAAAAENKYSRIIVLHQQRNASANENEKKNENDADLISRYAAENRDLIQSLKKAHEDLADLNAKQAAATDRCAADADADQQRIRSLEVELNMAKEELAMLGGGGGGAGRAVGGRVNTAAGTSAPTGHFETDCRPEDAIHMAGTAAIVNATRQILEKANNAADEHAASSSLTLAQKNADSHPPPYSSTITTFKELRREAEVLHRQSLFLVDKVTTSASNEKRLNQTIQSLMSDMAASQEDKDTLETQLRRTKTDLLLAQQELQHVNTTLQYAATTTASTSRSPSVAIASIAADRDREREAKERGELTALRTVSAQLQTELTVARSEIEGLTIQKQSVEREAEAYRSKLLGLQQELTDLASRELSATEKANSEMNEWRRKAITAETRLASAQREAIEAKAAMEALLHQQNELLAAHGILSNVDANNEGGGGGSSNSNSNATITMLAERNAKLISESAATAIAAANQLSLELRAKEAEIIEKDLRIRQLLDEGAVTRRGIGSLISDWVSWRRSLDEQNAASNAIFSQAAAAANANGNGGGGGSGGASLVGLIAASPYFSASRGGSNSPNSKREPSSAAASSSSLPPPQQNARAGLPPTGPTFGASASVDPIHVPSRTYSTLEQLAYKLKTGMAITSNGGGGGGVGSSNTVTIGGTDGGAAEQGNAGNSGFVTPQGGATPNRGGGARGRSGSTLSIANGGDDNTASASNFSSYLSLHRDLLTAMTMLRGIITSQEAEDREFAAAQLRQSTNAATHNASTLSAASERHQRELLNEIATLQRAQQTHEERHVRAEAEIDRLRRALEKFRRDAASMEEALMVASDRDGAVVKNLQKDKERLEHLVDTLRSEREGATSTLTAHVSRLERQLATSEASSKHLNEENAMLQSQVNSLMKKVEESQRGGSTAAMLANSALAEAEAKRMVLQQIVDSAHQDLKNVLAELASVGQHLQAGSIGGAAATSSSHQNNSRSNSPNSKLAAALQPMTSSSSLANVKTIADRRLASLNQTLAAATASVREVLSVVADRLGPLAISEQILAATAAAASNNANSNKQQQGGSTTSNAAVRRSTSSTALFNKYMADEDGDVLLGNGAAADAFYHDSRSASQIDNSNNNTNNNAVPSQLFIALTSRLGALKYVPSQLSQALTDELTLMTEMLSVRDEQHARANETLRERQNEIAQLKRQAEASECETEQLVLTRRRLEAEVHELRTALNEANSRLHDVAHTATEDAAEKQRQRRRIELLEQQLEVARRNHEDEVRTLRARLDSVKQSADTDRDAKFSIEATAFAELEKCRNQITKLNHQLTTLKAKLLDVERENDELAQTEKQLSAQLKDREEKLERCTSMLVTAKSEIERVNTDLTLAKEQQQREAAHTNKGKEEIASIMRQAQDRIVELQEEVQSIRIERDAARDRVASLQQTVSDLQQRERSNTTSNNNANHRRKARGLILRPVGFDAETSDEDGEGYVTITKYFQLKHAHQSSQRLLEEMGRQVESEKQHSRNVSSELQSCLATLRQLKDDFVTVQTQNDALAASNNSLSRRLAIVEADRDPLRERLKDAIMATTDGGAGAGGGASGARSARLIGVGGGGSSARSSEPYKGSSLPLHPTTTTATTTINANSSATTSSSSDNAVSVAARAAARAAALSVYDAGRAERDQRGGDGGGMRSSSRGGGGATAAELSRINATSDYGSGISEFSSPQPAGGGGGGRGSEERGRRRVESDFAAAPSAAAKAGSGSRHSSANRRSSSGRPPVYFDEY